MPHKLLLCALTSTLLSGLSTFSTAGTSTPPEIARPNIVWLVTEDNSKHYLKLYDHQGASMPAVEELAEDGLVFTNAFSNSPVCSTARTTLATGLYTTTTGTMNHRGYTKAELPDGLPPFSELLRRAGYYTSNNVKTDYNFSRTEEWWDELSNQAHWRGRAEGQPFFHMQTFGITHEGKLHFKPAALENSPTTHAPEDIELAPIYPDTPLFRYTHARTLDNHLKADRMIAGVLEQLKQDGELENTFIFYFGDHGGVLPGSKGYVYERGLSVPLVIRIPENFKHLVGKGLEQEGTRVNGLVSFIDFAPTALQLASIEIPDAYPGKAFLSANASLEQLNLRDEAYGQADRFDEKSDLVRSLRKGNLKYIRNYQPYYPDGLENFYRYKQEAYKEWRALFHAGELNAQQAAFFKPKQSEALYDLEVDPYETNNLAQHPDYQPQLLAMRAQLRAHQVTYPDLGFIPESHLVQTEIESSLYAYGRTHSAHIQELIDIADLQLLPFEQAMPKLKAALEQDDANKVYRALVSATSFGKQAAVFTTKARELLVKSNSIQVQSRAMEFLTLVANDNPITTFNALYGNAKHDMEKVELLNIAALLKEQRGFIFEQPSDLNILPPVKGTPSAKVDTWLYNRWQYITQQ
ncbi:sulfatase [Microbulbifer agarilyticus]|uniref:sulfatase family protein n=1 Tax=Microbulbifer agarilyticus TaxID=260552 RepID=UPI001C9439AB|nr:sulfatase [Microbulbifer agarilyticus]MBY6210943.1 sulfatase [Microbulbifer agarilyticus]